MTVEYRDESEFSNELHSVSQIADALRHKKFGKDVREAIAQAVEKLYGIGPSTVISGSPAGAYATLAELKSAYPNGQQGVFVVAETGKWYLWDPRKEVWIEGGNFQTPMSQSEIEDGRIWGDGTKSNSIGAAIRGQILKEKNERIQNIEQEKIERIQNIEQEKIERIKNIEQEKIERIKNDEKLQWQINLYSTALDLKEVRLRDEQNQLLWDGNDYVTGNVYLPKTDKTGTEEGVPADSSIIGYTFLGHLEEYGLPILKLESPDLLNLTSKEQGKLKGVKFDYNPNGNEGVRLSGTLKSIKIQGNGSAIYPKKNYTLVFSDDVCFKGQWGKNHHKYVIKADWTDFSQIRNEFGAWLWGQIRKTLIDQKRDVFVKTTTSNLVNENGDILVGETSRQFLGPNFGAIDSYPVLVIINGIYHGLYSMCVPKDDWMANMGYGDKEAIISADGLMNQTTRFKELDRVDKKGNLTGEGFGVEYVSDEKNQSWVAESINTLITNVISTTGSVDGIRDYIDIDSVHDYLIMNVAIGNVDAYIRNFILDTWDGIKWYIVSYDMDSVLGNFWHGKTMTNIETTDFDSVDSTNRLFHLVYKYDKDRFLERWNFLRNSILSDNNLYVALANFANKIPQAVLDYEEKLWPGRPSTRISNINQIQNWLMLRLKYLDRKIIEITEES